jgi:uncharacterized protein YigE (DUF2233 family)
LRAQGANGLTELFFRTAPRFGARRRLAKRVASRERIEERAMRRSGIAALFLLVGLTCCAAAGPAAAECAPRAFDGAAFTVCAFDPRHDDLRLFWKGADDRPFGSLGALAESLRGQGQRLVFAMNAGMFREDQSPVGLYVEKSRQLRNADTRGGESNFRLKPNGVFWIGDGVAGVTETGRYLANPPAARYATQSGPMLLIDGKIHPRIRPDGTSAKIRNGVGVDDRGEAVFAIADEPVTFDAFARLFRDGLNCRNALFLDGSLSSLYAPELKRDDELMPIGPIVGVVKPQAMGNRQ